MQSLLRTIICLLAICLAFLPGTVRAQETADNAVSSFIPPLKILDWAIHTPSKRLFAISSRKLLVFDYGGRRIDERDLTEIPQKIAIKSNVIVVLSIKPMRLEVFGMDDLASKKKVALSKTNAGRMCCSEEDNRFVYVFESGKESKIIRVDVESGATESKPLAFDQGTIPVMSQNGSALGLYGGQSIAGFRFDESNFSLSRIDSPRITTGGDVAVAPLGDHWFTRGRLYSRDLNLKDQKFELLFPAALSSTYDLVIGIRRDNVSDSSSMVFFRRSNGEELKSVVLNGFVPQENHIFSGYDIALRRRLRLHLTLRSTRDGKTIFLGMPKYAAVVDVSKLDLQLRTVKQLEMATDTTAIHGSRFTLDLASVLKPEGPTKYEITKGPANLRVNGEQLVWEPSLSMLGNHEVVINAKSAESENRIDIPLTARLPRLKFDAPVQAICVDPKAEFAAVFNSRQADTSGTLSIVDIQQMKVVQTKAFNQSPILALDESFLYLAPRRGTMLYKLDKKSLKVRKRQQLRSPVSEIHVLSGNRLLLNNTAKGCALLQSSNLTSVRNIEGRGAVFPLPDGYFQYGAQVCQPNGDFCCMAPLSYTNFTARLNKLVDRNYGSYRICTTPQVPLVLAIEGRTKQQFRIFDFKGNQLANFSLPSQKRKPFQFRFSHRPDYIDFRIQGQRIVLAANDWLIATRITTQDLEKKPQSPLHIIPPKLPIGTHQEGIKITIQAKGGPADKVDYSVESDFDEVRIEPGTGQLTIDTPRLWQQLLNNIRRLPATVLAKRSNSPNRLQHSSGEIPGVQANPKQIAFRGTIKLKATAASLDESQLQLRFFVTGPRAKYDDLMKKAIPKVEDVLAAQPKQRTPPKPLPKVPVVEVPVTPPSVDSQKELNAQLRRMEAMLDSVLRRIEAIEQKQDNDG